MTGTRTEPLLVVIGPSGVGKSTMVRALADERVLTICPTWTTRPRRSTEWTYCPEHRFVDERTFTALDSAGFFRATGGLPGLPYRYGLPRRTPAGPGVPTVIGRAAHVPVLLSLGPVLVYQLRAEPSVIARRLGVRRTDAGDLAARAVAIDAELRAGAAVAHRTFRTGRPLAALLADVRDALADDLGRAAA